MAKSPRASHDIDYEEELTASREEVAAVLRDLADGILTGTISVGDGGDAVSVDVPDDVSLEIELATEDDETSLEVELEWPASVGETGPQSIDTRPEETNEEPAIPSEAPVTGSVARFEVFRDTDEEWRWRLVHDNGNIIATSGEGYTRKRNAKKGLRSVKKNSPAAKITERPTN